MQNVPDHSKCKNKRGCLRQIDSPTTCVDYSEEKAVKQGCIKGVGKRKQKQQNH